MQMPNLFIVGAPKCGTTSMAFWLSEHPNVFVCNPKEPTYFAFDLKKSYQRTESEYRELFKEAKAGQLVVDASTRYLVSEIAIEAALSVSPQAKFIAMVRSPVDMFLSLHNHLYQTGLERESSSETAWQLQATRKSDRAFQSRHPQPESLDYSRMCSLGQQMERFFWIVPAAQRKIVVLDDLEHEGAPILRDTMDFLGLEATDTDLTPQNVSFRARSHFLKRIIRGLATMRRSIGWERGLGILDGLTAVNRKVQAKKRCSNTFENYLRRYFSNDVKKLSELLERDLSHWVHTEDGDTV